MNELQTTITQEEQTYLYWKELGEKESNAKSERETIRKTEIDPGLDDGLFFGINGRGLRLSYESYIDFDWQRAVYEGKLPQSVVDEYAKVKVKRVLRDVNMAEDEAENECRLNVVRAHSPALFHLVAALASGDVPPQEVAQEVLCRACGGNASEVVASAVEAARVKDEKKRAKTGEVAA
jgi:hypothetical protein